MLLESESKWNNSIVSGKYIDSLYTPSGEIRLAKHYYHDPYFYSLLPGLDEKKVLDVGCGNFYMLSELLSSFPNAHCYGLDYPNMLSQEKCNYDEMDWNYTQNTNLIAGSADRLPFKDHVFDVVYSSLLLHWIKNLDNMAEELYRVSAKSSKFVVSLAHPLYFKAGKFVTDNGEDYLFIPKVDMIKRQDIEVMLDGVIGPITYYRRPVDEYRKVFERKGFSNVLLHEPLFNDREKMNQFPSLKRYKNYPLYLIITGEKLIA